MEGTFLKRLSTLEEDLQEKTGWGVKLVEGSGRQLLSVFKSRLPVEQGCPLGDGCRMCDQDAVKCTPKGVYSI